MKLAHKNKDLPSSKTELLAEAVAAEADGQLEIAASAYEKLLKQDPGEEYTWNRLMIIYRKLKDFKKELATINAGISNFEGRFNKPKIAGKKITTLSTAILKLTGLADRKGKSIYEPEPIGRWKKRKALVLKRMKK